MLVAPAVVIAFAGAVWQWGVDSRIEVEDDRLLDKPSRRWMPLSRQ